MINRILDSDVVLSFIGVAIVGALLGAMFTVWDFSVLAVSKLKGSKNGKSR